MSEHYPRIRVHSSHGFLLIRDGLSFTFYMHHPHVELAWKVERSLNAYRGRVGQGALCMYTDEEGDWWTLDEEGQKLIRRRFLHPKQARIRLAGGPGNEHIYEFDYIGKEIGNPELAQEPGAVSAVSFWLSTEYLEEHGPGRVRELAMELAAPLPFCSGHAGLSFNCDLGLMGIPREVLKWCFRYPGMDLPNMHNHSWCVGTRVPTISWLTFLGQPVLGELGGAAGLRSQLQSPGTTVQEMEGDRAVVTLGPSPEAGDTEKGLLLPAHRELARVLEPWTYFTPPEESSYFSPEDQRRWERRFLD